MRTLVKDFGMELLDKQASYMADPRKGEPNNVADRPKYIPRISLGDLRKCNRDFISDLNILEHMSGLLKKQKRDNKVKTSASLSQMHKKEFDQL